MFNSVVRKKCENQFFINMNYQLICVCMAYVNLRLKKVQQLRENEEVLGRLEERKEMLSKLQLEKLEKIEKIKRFFKNKLKDGSCDMCNRVLTS